MGNSYRRSALYRSRRGLLFGVCRGVAEYLNVSVFWTRIITLAAFVFTGFWPVGALYLAAALLLKREPVWCACPSGATARDTDYDRMRARAGMSGSLDARLRRMEAAMEQDRYDWQAQPGRNG